MLYLSLRGAIIMRRNKSLYIVCDDVMFISIWTASILMHCPFNTLISASYSYAFEQLDVDDMILPHESKVYLKSIKHWQVDLYC